MNEPSPTEPMSILVILAPETLEDRLIDELLMHPQWVSGFSSQNAEGHGSRAAHASARERVRGRERRVRLEAVATRANLQAMVEHLRRELPQPGVVYWVQALEDFGRLA